MPSSGLNPEEFRLKGKANIAIPTPLSAQF
jgi:hypothetical protein